MNCIIQMVHNSIMGSVIDALEYWAVANLYKPTYLVLLQIPKYGIPDYKNYLLKVFKDRYIINNDWNDRVIILDRLSLLKTRFNKVVILDYGTISHIKGLLRADEIIIISEDTSDQYMLKKDLYNVTYYGEMPFVYKDIEYRMKLAFDLFKPIGVSTDAIYVNCPNEPDNQDMLKYVISKNKTFFFKAPKHQNSLFELFDEFLYFHSSYFDPHPRLLLEAAYYNKKIDYKNPNGIKDGSYYRYLDLETNGLYNRNLDKNDEIIRFLIGN